MILEVEIPQKFVMAALEAKLFVESVRQMCLIKDFDLSKPISVRINHDRLSVSYLQDRDDL